MPEVRPGQVLDVIRRNYLVTLSLAVGLLAVGVLVSGARSQRSERAEANRLTGLHGGENVERASTRKPIARSELYHAQGTLSKPEGCSQLAIGPQGTGARHDENGRLCLFARSSPSGSESVLRAAYWRQRHRADRLQRLLTRRVLQVRHLQRRLHIRSTSRHTFGVLRPTASMETVRATTYATYEPGLSHSTACGSPYGTLYDFPGPGEPWWGGYTVARARLDRDVPASHLDCGDQITICYLRCHWAVVTDRTGSDFDFEMSVALALAAGMPDNWPPSCGCRIDWWSTVRWARS